MCSGPSAPFFARTRSVQVNASLRVILLLDEALPRRVKFRISEIRSALIYKSRTTKTTYNACTPQTAWSKDINVRIPTPSS
jgi:hypothetical protein